MSALHAEGPPTPPQPSNHPSGSKEPFANRSQNALKMARACDAETGYMRHLAAMQQVLVIGGTGLIGVPTVRELVERDAHVRVMTRSAAKAAALSGHRLSGIAGDLNRSYSLREA